MQVTIEITGTIDSSNETVDFDAIQFEGDAEVANYQGGVAWYQSGKLPDGRDCRVRYEFSAAELEAAGEHTDRLPFDAEHATVIVDEPAKWHVGDTYWQAEAQLHGGPRDIGATPQRDSDEAVEEGKIWLSDLTARERASAKVWVREYRVIDVYEDGSPSAVSTSTPAIEVD